MKTLLSTILFFVVCYSHGFCANLIYSEDFEDGDVDQPFHGSITSGGPNNPYEITASGGWNNGRFCRASRLSYATYKYMTGNNEWTASGVNNEYYYNSGIRGLPSEPVTVRYGTSYQRSVMAKGTVGALGNNEWGWNNDTIYVRLSDLSDPDTKASDYICATFIADTEGDGDVNEGHPFLVWFYDDDWVSDELYVSVWWQYEEFVATGYYGDENIKMYYWYEDVGNNYYWAAGLRLNTLWWYSDTFGGGIGAASDNISTNVMDGDWHKCAMYIKFTTSEIKFWVDGVLEWSFNGNDGAWDGYIEKFTISGSVDTTGSMNGRRNFDDIEVWDGIPDDTCTIQSITLQGGSIQ